MPKQNYCGKVKRCAYVGEESLKLPKTAAEVVAPWRERAEKAEAEVARLRKLCADRPKAVQHVHMGMPSLTKTFITWVDKIDAAGREDGTK